MVHRENTCYIAGAGEFYDKIPRPQTGDMVIAADGGLRYVLAADIRPDLIIGDFDSLGTIPSGPDVILLPAEKDNTDMQAAISEGWKRGFRSFSIFGGTGGRIDHTAANIQCIAWIARNGGRGYLYGNGFTVTAIYNSSIRMAPKASGMISVFAYGGAALGVFESGLKYSLSDSVLNDDIPMGISNEFTGKESFISVSCGTLLIIYPDDTEEIIDNKEIKHE